MERVGILEGIVVKRGRKEEASGKVPRETGEDPPKTGTPPETGELSLEASLHRCGQEAQVGTRPIILWSILD